MIKLNEYFVIQLRDLSDALEPLGINWAVAGAVAANNYRDQIRSTTDIDVLLTLADQEMVVVLDALRQHGWESVDVITEYLIRSQHPIAGRLDILVSGTDYEVGAIARAQRAYLDDNHTFRTLAIEDVIILKLFADRYIDRSDILSILMRRPTLDWDYLTKWLKEFELEHRLDEIESSALAKGELTGPIRSQPNQQQAD